MKHTPGPHTVEYQPHLGDSAYAIRAADGDLIAVGLLNGDADLFAAAPELLSMVRELVDVYWGDGDSDPKNPPQIIKRANALIARATAASSEPQP